MSLRSFTIFDCTSKSVTQHVVWDAKLTPPPHFCPVSIELDELDDRGHYDWPNESGMGLSTIPLASLSTAPRPRPTPTAKRKSRSAPEVKVEGELRRSKRSRTQTTKWRGGISQHDSDNDMVDDGV